MKRSKFEVVKKAGIWRVTRDGSRLYGVPTQRQAIEYAVLQCRILLDLGQHSTLKIKRPNGQIRDERTYGADPRKTKG